MSDVRTEVSAATATDAGSRHHGGFIWYELMTTDPEGAKAFYDSVVGWSIGPAHDAIGYRMIGRSDGGNAGGLLPLTAEMQQHGARPAWLGYINVPDVDDALVAIEQAGGRTLMPARDIDQAGKIALVSDPTGAAFYVMTPAPPSGSETKGSDVFSVDQPQHVRWNELSTTDPDRAVEFYARQFGWKQEGEMDMGELGKYRFVQHDGVTIGAIMPKMPQLPMSLWSFYIGVDDVDRAVQATTAGGGSILNGPMEIPGGEFAVNAMDPRGAAFGLVGPRKA